ncbi:hypothetical protein ACSAZK_12790 [Methanosarcina sp. Mfa9]|uniref:hypothetical protein n=1 Tax=Methanosarcina sp. Mfa9 TaxID=3439063 RepID=UPI003F84BE35
MTVVFHKFQVFLLMLTTGTFLFFAKLLRKDLFEALKLGLYPATFGFFSGKIRAYFNLRASGNNALFSAYAPIKVLFVATLTETAYCLLCHRHSKPEIPPTFPQADLVPVRMAMNKPRFFYPGFSKSMAGGARTGQTSPVVHISNIRRKYETNKSVTK